MLFRIVISILFILFINNSAFAQITSSSSGLPDLSGLSINARATEKTFDFIVNQNNSTFDQNIVLDSTGSVLFLNIPSSLKKVGIAKLLDNENNEIEFLTGKNGKQIAVVDKNKKYKLIEEIKPDCTKISKGFIDKTNLICPDKIIIKTQKNLTFPSDTEITAASVKPFQNFLLNVKTDTSNIFIPGKVNLNNLVIPAFQESSDDTSSSSSSSSGTPFIDSDPTNTLPTEISYTELLGNGDFCIVSKDKSVFMEDLSVSKSCTIDDENTNAIVVFKENLKNITSSDFNLIIPIYNDIFMSSKHEVVFELNNEILSESDPIEITDESEKFNFDGNKYLLNLNFGTLDTTKIKLNKNSFELTTPISFTGNLVKKTFTTSITENNALLKPSSSSDEALLTEVNLSGISNNNPNNFSITSINNIVLPNFIEVAENSSRSFKLKDQKSNQDTKTLSLTTFIPIDDYDLTLKRKYSLIEQTKQPSVDEDTGEAIEIVNDKARLDLSLKKDFIMQSIVNDNNSFELIVSNNSTFTNSSVLSKLFKVSGFLFPPDQRPIIESGYRATISFEKEFEIKKNEFINFFYSELKTKDEVKITNFFNFMILPESTFSAKLKFNGNRKKFFQNIDLVEEDKD